MRTTNFYFTEREDNQKLVSELIKQSEKNPGYVAYQGIFNDFDGCLGEKGKYSHHFILERGAGIICSRESGLVQIAVQDGDYNLQETLIDLTSLTGIPKK